ncbi:11392_t:CDS:2 [Paraglomus brasilianum]|uniref:11392_t:CDS:1 n=1 Tax=Paraglomus brasilianum TaxID=144538 RepID=A0A9N9AXL8_9GLOM|nr:11392_t:CDS:2 [Paraglomus brasilianum]
MSYDGSYESIQKETVEKVLDTRLSDIIEVINDKLNELIDEVNKSRTEGKEQIMDGGTATPLVAGALVGAGGLGGYLVGNVADKEDTEREKMLLQDQRYRDAMGEVNQQIDANNQIKKQITDIEGKLNGTIPRQPNETDEHLKTQLAILTGNLRNGEGRLNGLKNELDKLRKELGGGSSLMNNSQGPEKEALRKIIKTLSNEDLPSEEQFVGSGKSTLANALSGTDKFQERQCARSVNNEVQIEEFEDNGIIYKIVDTVGLGDLHLSKEQVLSSLEGAVHVIGEGLNQILFVSNARSRVTKEEINVYKSLQEFIFDKNSVKHTTIVRTNFVNFMTEKECKRDERDLREIPELTEFIGTAGSDASSITNEKEKYEFFKKTLEEDAKDCEIIRKEDLKKILENYVTKLEKFDFCLSSSEYKKGNVKKREFKKLQQIIKRVKETLEKMKDDKEINYSADKKFDPKYSAKSKS